MCRRLLQATSENRVEMLDEVSKLLHEIRGAWLAIAPGRARTMTSPIADGVLAATHRLVQQAMTGQWQDVPKTVQERRVLLDKLSASASPQDQQWLGALQQAMAESDAAVAQMAHAELRREPGGSVAGARPRAAADAPSDQRSTTTHGSCIRWSR